MDFGEGYSWNMLEPCPFTLQPPDILFSGLGTGTALFNAIWLLEGSAVINLGGMKQDASGMLRGFPQYGEEFSLAWHRGIKVLYLLLQMVQLNPTAQQLQSQIQEAVRLICAGFEFPTKLEESYSILGRTVHELEQTTTISATSLYGDDHHDRNSRDKRKCVATFPSEIVYELKISKETCNIP